MRELTRQGRTNPTIRAKAIELTRGLKQKNWTGEIAALHEFVRDQIRYVKDIRDVETVATPETVLEIGVGDCDDKAVLLASLLESIGHPAMFRAVGFAPGVFSHVYVKTLIGRRPGRWVGLETTEPKPLGWEPPNIRASMKRHV